MTFADLIRGHSLFVVKNRLLHFYPDTLYAHAAVYEQLMVLKQHKNNMYIILEYVVDEEENLVCIEVLGRDGGDEKDVLDKDGLDVERSRILFSIVFSPCDQWLGMTIDPETIEAFEPLP